MSADALIAPASLVVEPDPDPNIVDTSKSFGADSGLGPGPASVIADCGQQHLTPAAFPHSPPDSNNATKSEASDSELSDLDDEPILDNPLLPSASTEKTSISYNQTEDDIGEISPDHWSGAVPVFRPSMLQFKDFQAFMNKVDGYGMKSGIIKIIPPSDWAASQPALDDLVKLIKIREPIKQDIMGSNGTYRQVNILHGRSYNLPQWRQLCEQSEHQPPARRGERRANAERPKPPRPRSAAPKSAVNPSTPKKRGRSRNSKNSPDLGETIDDERPMTPESPRAEVQSAMDEPVDTIEKDPCADEVPTAEPLPDAMIDSKKPKQKTQTISARRKCGRREGSAVIDEAAFQDFDYRMDISEYTPERCEELERIYWKTLTYATPLYGADLMGTLFDDRTEVWNLNKLPNLLDVLGTRVPGVNTAYLYLGMWKATFAWHLEDVDLYSINYLHFGAPKQWYSISQADARRFEAAMKNIWPADAKACDQFLRHKSFLISPHHLLQHYGIKVNRVVSYPGEFVVTYPYGYHSGYNLGYNCAEAVNFALDSWLEMGKIAKKCECAQAQDSVWINVYEIERKLRGEETDYEETDEEEDEDTDEELSGLPTPPASHKLKFKGVGRKRKRNTSSEKKAKVKVKKIKLRVREKVEPPCCLCPHDIPGFNLVPTDDGRRAHRLCALYVPETYINTENGEEVVCNVTAIHKDRRDLKCLFCRSKRGACFQCSQKKCARSYHATCAAAAGVFVEEQDIPVFADDGTEYREQASEFSCRFHRAKRDKTCTADDLEADARIRAAAAALEKGQVCQFQYHKGDIFAGLVVENREDEQTLLIAIIPKGDHVEVEWKWLLLPDPSDFHLPKASAKAIAMPASREAKALLNAKRLLDEKPRKDEPFADGYTWAEFQLAQVENESQVKPDLTKADQIWHYLGSTSTEAKAQYTEDPSQPRHNPKGNFLTTVPKPPRPAPAPKAASRRPSTGLCIDRGTGTHHGSTISSSQRNNSAASILSSGRPLNLTSDLLCRLPGLAGVRLAQQTSSLASLLQQPQHDRIPSQQDGRAQHPAQIPDIAKGGTSPAPLSLPSPSAQMPTWTKGAQLKAPHPPEVGGYRRASIAGPGNGVAQQQNRPTWQVYSSTCQKYPFFQVHHNRNSFAYRTPYGPWGGFTNGYEGDLRTQSVSRESNFLRKSLSKLVSLPNQILRAPEFAETGKDRQGNSVKTQTSLPPAVLSQAGQARLQGMASSPPLGPPLARPAIKHQFWPAKQHDSGPYQQPTTPKSRWSEGGKSHKVGLPAAVHLSLKSTKLPKQAPLKQSPVPLPANFLAAMNSSAASMVPDSVKAGPKGDAGTDRLSKPTSNEDDAGKIGTERASVEPEMKAKSAQAEQPSSAAQTGLGCSRERAPMQEEGRGTASVQESTLPMATDASNEVEAKDGTATVPAGSRHGPTDGAAISEGGDSGGAAGPELEREDACDFAGFESMDFVERMMRNLRRASQREEAVS